MTCKPVDLPALAGFPRIRFFVPAPGGFLLDCLDELFVVLLAHLTSRELTNIARIANSNDS